MKPPTLAQAIKRWRAMPVVARRAALHFFRDEAKSSANWGVIDVDVEERIRHRTDARCLMAAVELLKAAAKARRK